MKVGPFGFALIVLLGGAVSTSYAKPPHHDTAKTVAKPAPKAGVRAARVRHGAAHGPARKEPGVPGMTRPGTKPHSGAAKMGSKPAPKTGLGAVASQHGTLGGPAKIRHGTVGGPVNKGPGITGTGIKPKH